MFIVICRFLSFESMYLDIKRYRFWNKCYTSFIKIFLSQGVKCEEHICVSNCSTVVASIMLRQNMVINCCSSCFDVNT